MAHDPPQSSPHGPRLGFDWRTPVRQHRGLMFWMLVTCFAMAGFFYLFQVVYPQPQRFTPVPQRLLMLNQSDPTARALMQKVLDQDYLVVPTGSDLPGVVDLATQAPRFRPSFEGHEMTLLDLPQKTTPVPPARLLQVDEPLLPPLDLSALKPLPATPPPATRPTRLTLRLTGALESRRPERPPDFTGITLADPGTCRFQLGVKPDGRVDFALPMDSAEDPEVLRRLTTLLRSLRFNAVPGSSSAAAWGVVGFTAEENR